MKTVVGRFAPSPSGRMHLGNVFCALLAWLSVRKQNGQMLLRIEDLDPARCRQEYAEQLLDDLQWLGLDWDAGGLDENYRQSQCTAFYEAAVHKLSQQTYPCFCTRAQLHAASAPHGTQWIYHGACRTLTETQILQKQRLRQPALRLRVPAKDIAFTDGIYGSYQANLAQSCGDFILRRSDGVYAYQLAVVVDDARMGVTEILRGRDLLSSTPQQLYLYEQLGSKPPVYCHIPLLCAPDGRRLSKREKDLDMGVLRTRFGTAQALLGRLAQLAGLRSDSTPCSAAELIADYDIHKIPKKDIVITNF